jgi:hypothetical protein
MMFRKNSPTTPQHRLAIARPFVRDPEDAAEELP